MCVCVYVCMYAYMHIPNALETFFRQSVAADTVHFSVSLPRNQGCKQDSTLPDYTHGAHAKVHQQGYLGPVTRYQNLLEALKDFKWHV
jgi:hypothetical protein